MKIYTVAIGLALLLFTARLSAQYCRPSSGLPVIDTTLNLPAGSFYPLWYSIPCAVDGQFFSQVIQAQNYSTYQGYQVDSISIDSITNLPCGLCWTSSSPDNIIRGGAPFAIQISGTPNETPQSIFLMWVYVRAWVNGSTSPYNLQSTDSTLFVYYLRTADASGNCYVDFDDAFVNSTYYNACSGATAGTCNYANPIVSVTGLAGNCLGDSTATLSVLNPESGLSYDWYVFDILGNANYYPIGTSVNVSGFAYYGVAATADSNGNCQVFSDVDITPAGADYGTSVCYLYTDTATGYTHIILDKNPLNTEIRKYLLFKTNGGSLTPGSTGVGLPFDTNSYIRYRIDSLVATIDADSLGEFIDTTGNVLRDSSLAAPGTYSVVFYSLGFINSCGQIDTFFNGAYPFAYAYQPPSIDTTYNSNNRIQININFPSIFTFIGYVQRQIGSGAFQTIDSVYAFSGSSIYVDNTIYGLVSYRVMFMTPPICSPARSNGLIDVYSNTVTFFSTNGLIPTGVSSVSPQKNDLVLTYSQDGSHLIANFDVADGSSIVNVQILDLTGREVLSQDWGQISQGNYTRSIDMSSLSTSSYILCLYTDGQRECAKIIKY